MQVCLYFYEEWRMVGSRSVPNILPVFIPEVFRVLEQNDEGLDIEVARVERFDMALCTDHPAPEDPNAAVVLRVRMPASDKLQANNEEIAETLTRSLKGVLSPLEGVYVQLEVDQKIDVSA